MQRWEVRREVQGEDLSAGEGAGKERDENSDGET